MNSEISKLEYFQSELHYIRMCIDISTLESDQFFCIESRG